MYLTSRRIKKQKQMISLGTKKKSNLLFCKTEQKETFEGFFFYISKKPVA